MKKRARIVSGLAALAALFLAPTAEASITRSSAPPRETPALSLTLAAPELSEFSVFDGTEIARALTSRPAFDLISITTDESSTAVRTRFVSPSELSTDELPDGPELVPITSVREQRFNLRIPPDIFGLEPLRGPPGDEASYPKTRYRVFGLLGTPILGELRGVSLELHWRSASFSCGLASGTVGWLSQDPLGDKDSPNLYGFVGARPHEKTDPLGLEASLANNGTIVIADVHTGRIRRISPAEIAANGDEVRAALGLEAGLDPREADALMKRAGGGVWTNNAKVTALSKGVSEEVDREARFIAKTYAVTAGAAAAGVAAGALGAGAIVSGAVSGVGGLATSDVIEGRVSSPGAYAGAAAGGAIFGKIFGAASIGEGPSTLGLGEPPLFSEVTLPQGPFSGGSGPKLLSPPKIIRHHIFNKFRGTSPKSQVYRDFFKKHGVDVDKYAVDIPESMHQDFIHGAGRNWTTRWKRWIDENPNATTTEVYQFGGRLMDEYGLSGLPIVKY